MKIAYLAPSWPQSARPNGIVSYLAVLTEAIEALGHEIFIVTPQIVASVDGRHVTQIENQRARSLFGQLSDGLLFRMNRDYAFYRTSSKAISLAFRKLIEREGIDIIEMEETFGWCCRVARDVEIPVIARLHGPHFLVEALEHRKRAGRMRREGRGLRAVAAITSPSRCVLDATRRFYNLDHQRCKVVPGAIRAAAESDMWSLTTCDHNQILFVGRFDNQKGADLVLKAFSTLLDSAPNLRLNFVGPDNGVEVSPGVVYRWERYIHEFIDERVSNRIHYYGRLSPSEIAPLRVRSFATIMASRYENFPNTCLEALAHGCPLVATNVGGIGEIARHERNGLLAEPNNADDLAAKIKFLLDNPETAMTFGRIGWQDCRDRFDPSAIAASAIDFYETILDQD